MASLIKSPKDFYSGALFAAFGLAAVVIGRDYPMGTSVRMGPGYFPTILGGILLVMGGILMVRGMITRGEPVGQIALKSLILILGAVAIFAATVDWLGLVFAVSAVILVSIMANTERVRPIEAIALYVAMLVLSVGLFAYGLALPFKIWPG